MAAEATSSLSGSLPMIEGLFQDPHINDETSDEKSSQIGRDILNTESPMNSQTTLALPVESTSNTSPLNDEKKEFQKKFFKKIDLNILNQLKNYIQEELEEQEKENPSFLFLHLINSIIEKIKQSDFKGLDCIGFENSMQICVLSYEGEKEEYAKIKKIMLKIIFTYYVGINALNIHQEAVQFYIPTWHEPKDSHLEKLFRHTTSLNRPPIVTELGNLWALAFEKSTSTDGYIGDNFPNQLFKIKIQRDKHPINFFRMRSPKTDTNNLSPLYELFLDHHQQNSSRHLSLITLSPSTFKQEKKIANLRFQAQESRPNHLFAWAFEPDTEFASQDIELQKDEVSDSFLKRLSSSILLAKDPTFKFPENLLQDKIFINTVEDTIKEVKNIFFPDHKRFTSDEKRDYILMTVILLMEHFCERNVPSTVDTACHSHIDRGIMVSSVLYVYLMIKSGNHNNNKFIEYLKPLILAPALLVENRPPHQPRMTAILSLITRMLQPSAIEKIQKSKTYFTNCELEIPN